MGCTLSFQDGKIMAMLMSKTFVIDKPISRFCANDAVRLEIRSTFGVAVVLWSQNMAKT